MSRTSRKVNRRQFVASTAAAGLGLSAAGHVFAEDNEAAHVGKNTRALVAITMDLEMSRHYPTWEVMHWDYEKGNLNQQTKQYIVEACRRVKAKGWTIQSFVLGRVFEQDNVDWMKEVVAEGHPVGNHTYDHVNVWSTRPQDLQFRFRRCPWLIEGKTNREVIMESIQLTSRAMQQRIGVSPIGFRTPGGSAAGLIGRLDVQQMMLDSGFTWVSSMAKHVPVKPVNPTTEDFQRVAHAQKESQPFVYPSGLIEIPMSPLGDVASFRREKEKWRLDEFLKMIEASLTWVIEDGAVFDLLTHPSIMYIEDPEFRAYELICDLVNQAKDRAAIVGLDAIAQRFVRGDK